MTSTLDVRWRILHDRHRAYLLSQVECRALAALGTVGRLAFEAGSRPDIILTNYVWGGDRIFLPAALADRLVFPHRRQSRVV